MISNTNPFTSNILKNIFSLGFVKLSSYLFPIIITPIISRALGTEGYGTYLFFISITNYMFLVIDWGFQFYGPRIISLSDNEGRYTILYHILASKFFLGLVTILILALVLSFTNFDLNFFWFYCAITIGFALNPLFYFHGIGKIYLPAIVNFFIRLCSLPLFFYLVDDPSDLNIVIGIFVSSQLLISLIAILFIKKTQFEFNKLLKIFLSFSFFDSIKKSFKIFISNSFVTIYSNAGIIVLGLLTSYEAISIFGSSMMLITVSKSVLNPISLVLYPETVKMDFSKNYKNNIVLWTQILVSTSITIFVLLSGNLLIDFLFGEDFHEAKFLLKLLSPIPILVAISNFFGVQILLAKGLEFDFMKITFLGTIITIIFLFILIPIYGSLGAAISILLCELLVAFCSIYFVKKNFKLNENAYE